MSEYDVLIIGGYGLTDVSGGGIETRSKMLLWHKDHPASVDFLKLFVENKGDLSITDSQYSKIDKSKFINRSLNVIYLYDFLRKNNIRVEVLNYFLLEQNKFKNLISLKPKVVVISTTFIYNVNEIISIAKKVKELSPTSVVIAGGIKILKSFKKYSLNQKDYFKYFDFEQILNNNFFFDPDKGKDVDILVIEENGELTLLELIKKIINKQDYKTTPNIAFVEKNNFVFTKRVAEETSLESYIVDWKNIPNDIIGNEIPVRAGIGCPFRCAFCDFTGLHKVRLRSVESLINELRVIQETFPGKGIFFTDDNLFTNRKRTKDLADSIVNNKLSFRWRAFFRVDAIGDENAASLAKSGCVGSFLGVESGDENILQNMSKKSTKSKILNAVRLLNENGISTLSTIIIGFPGETEESVKNTIDLLNNYPEVKGTINQYYPFVFILMPLAPIASPENMKKYGIKGGYENWAHNTMNSDEAKSYMLKLFREVKSLNLIYPEFIKPVFPLEKIKSILKARDNIVKEGNNLIDARNSSSIYNTFSNIISK